MSEPKQHVVDDLAGCAVSLSAFYIAKDLNIRLSCIQQVNKDYNAMSNKLESGNISATDLDNAVSTAKEKLSSEIERKKSSYNFDKDDSEKLVQACPSKVDQLVNFLKTKRVLQIDVSMSFKEPSK